MSQFRRPMRQLVLAIPCIPFAFLLLDVSVNLFLVVDAKTVNMRQVACFCLGELLMKSCLCCLAGILLCSISSSIAVGQGLELRWVESKPIEGVTEDEGVQRGDDPDDIVYVHKKPVIVLDSALAEMKIEESKWCCEELFLVTLELTDEARTKIATSVQGNQMRILTAKVNGEYHSFHRYEIDRDKKGVPKGARADTFTVSLGVFRSRDEAERMRNVLE